jgi:hypothetical protein
MAMRDHRSVHWPQRVNEKSAGFAEQPVRQNLQPGRWVWHPQDLGTRARFDQIQRMDADLPTLHIRCGTDIHDNLRGAGFAGDFLEYSDPICEGPVPDVPDLIPIRARYLAANYGASKTMTEAQFVASLRQADQQLAEAWRYQRVVLWFERDSYDQLILARILSRFAETTIPACLELICIDHHPDPPRFIGLGQLQPSALAALWPARRPVTPGQIALGQAIWSALRQPDPTGLQAIAQTATPALPIAAPALWRHLQELPGLSDGLSLTQRIVLTTLTDGPMPIGGIFAAMLRGPEPLPFQGDISVLATIEAMAQTTPPVLTINPGSEPFARLATLTETGRRVLSGTTDYLSLSPPERWVGGVRIIPARPTFRLNATTGCLA